MRIKSILPLILVFGMVAESNGLIVYEGTSANASAPTDDPGWANVGRITSSSQLGSGIYLGDGWILLARHAVTNGQGDPSHPAQFTLGSTAYDVDASTRSVIGDSDLALYRLSNPPSLPSLNLSTAAVTAGEEVVMISWGVRQANTNTVTGWEVSGNPNGPTWDGNADPGDENVFGYQWTTSRNKRWGENEVATANMNVSGPGGFLTTSFRTVFGMEENSAQGAVGDSGGAVFVKRNGEWELVGMMFATNAFPNQPSGASVANNFSIFNQEFSSSGFWAFDGNQTFSADLFVYRDDILAIIPEPSLILLMVTGLSILFFRRRRA